MAKLWRYLEKSPQAITLSEKLGLPPVLINILLHRGIDSEESIKEFIYGDKNLLSSPFSLINMASGAERIKKAIELGEKITIYGDYDVDGFCSATLLKRALNFFYANVDIYIPDRLEEGYGLNEVALNELLNQGTNLVVTVDCGVSSTDLVDTFLKKGLDFIITDHHKLPEILPKTIVINPLLERDSQAPYCNLSGCGVAFMLALALAEVLEADKKTHDQIFSLVDIAAIATIADVMKLTQDNRIIVKEGLKQIKNNPRTFIQTILDLANLSIETFDVETIGYQIAPRINACGRLNEIDLGINFLLEDDFLKSKHLAKEVEALNQRRKALAEEIWLDAIKQIESENRSDDTAIVVYGDYHQGVIGIVASKLVGHYGVPAIVLAKTSTGYTGSARSVKGYSLPLLLGSVSAYLTRYGGHDMAAGMSLETDKLLSFKKAFQEAVSLVDKGFSEDELEVALALNPNQVSPKLFDVLSLLEPTGNANPKPILSIYGKKGYSLKACGSDKSHLQITIDGFRGIGFGQAKHLDWFSPKENCDIAFTLKKNFFRGQERLEFILEDFRPSFLSGDAMDQMLFLEGEGHLIKDDYKGIELQKSFFTKLVGVSFEARQDLIKALADGASLSLQREEDNPVDFNAIQVVFERKVLGYLKKGLAKHLAPVIDNGASYVVKTWEKTGHDSTLFGINLQIERVDEGLAIRPEKNLKSYTDDDIKANLLPLGTYSKIQSEALSLLREFGKTLVIMPTGRGKSLIYQTRALELAREKKITVIVSPLRSLITDQYLKLKELTASLGLSIVKVTGDLAYSEKSLFLDNYSKGSYDVIFTTPEYLLAHQDVFVSKAVGLFVIDEAHYLASRRVGYKALKDLLSKFNCEYLALTATAEERTYKKIMEVLDNPQVVRDDFVKENQVLIDHRNVQDKLSYLRQLILKNEKTLVYVNSKKQAFEMAKRLRGEVSYHNREKIAYYHSGLPKKTREEVQKRFKENEYLFLIATSAFGEGIDIKDIKHLVFYHLPFSKESFNQIAGRAGRDGNKAYLHLLYGHHDESLNEKILDLLSPTREMLLDLYRVLKNTDSFDKPSQYDTSLLLRELEKQGHYYDKAQIKLGLNIFSELGLLALSKAEGVKLLRLLPQKGKLNLEDSMTFLEGQMERVAFLELKSIAFQNDLGIIENLLNKALMPIGEEDVL